MDTNNYIKDDRVYLGPTGNIFCVPSMRPIVPTGPSTNPTFLRHTVCFCKRGANGRKQKNRNIMFNKTVRINEI